MMRYSLLSLLLLTLVGCSQDPTGISIDSSNQQVVLNNSELANILEFGSAKTDKINDRLKAKLIVKNKTNKNEDLQYRFYWYDKQGLEINSVQSPWQPFRIYGGETKTLHGVSISPLAENFRVSICNLY